MDKIAVVKRKVTVFKLPSRDSAATRVDKDGARRGGTRTMGVNTESGTGVYQVATAGHGIHEVDERRPGRRHGS